MTISIPQRRPEWLKVRPPGGKNYEQLKQLMRGKSLHTVCEEARCPNIGECWGQKTATFMILGSVCTRSCGFCAVATGRPLGLDWEEPKRVAEAVKAMDLRHAVVTSVNRDELKDGGAAVFAATIRWIRRMNPACKVEILTPDFKGVYDAVRVVMDAKPDVFNHNVETVPRLYKRVRPQAIYERSLQVLKWAKEMHPKAPTKSGFMLGLGETWDEVIQVMRDLREHDVDILTIGQYLRPSFKHLPIERYVPLEEFDALKQEGLKLGFKTVVAGPFVRSSYHAREQAEEATEVLNQE
ncbi:lipoic acid synthetase [Thermosporothrix hazakensis]|jgi:lipoic acid synthetase|uniref:Lipoyl synthase n=2 Tax=Thermosporothrix TaxID=768650 RepID=A0A326UCU9_THEHA|nr:lipoyl synthase [Thermosporothrix hazakensis]PZW36327.1 lipoic acid synthetase [Thermosporothrix hazakensis]BBH88793.1 lipoyl synthase [Thermosporothrix sp. COM3]GCE46976.1 lipoyl synthase [Thermosporothrix hazakensis]